MSTLEYFSPWLSHGAGSMISMRLIARTLGALLLIFLFSSDFTRNHGARSSNLPDSVVIPFANHHRFTNFTKFSTSAGIAVYLLQTTEAWSVAAPTEHTKIEPTLRQAQRNGCGIGATNGGPFNPDGTSSGPLVIEGKLQSNQTESDYIGFGTTRNKKWVIGTFAQVRHLDPWDFVTGFGWLVYDGTIVANNSQNPTGAYQAARTAIGVDWNSSLLLMVSDGCERCLRDRNRGLTLEDLARILLDSGARYAINMDGGGSSTMVHGTKVVNRPTCLDIPLICQRPVSTVLCVSNASRSSQEQS